MTASPHPAKLQAALDLVARGFYLFPVDGKIPHIKNWEGEATTDPEQLKAWEALWPECNWGIAPDRSGHFVLDLDRKNGKDGVAEFERLSRELNFEISDTLVSETATTGLHIVLAGSAQSSAGRIAPGIDVRGRGGYVVAPGSEIDGKPYKIISDIDPSWEQIPKAPAVLLSLANQAREAMSAPDGVALDSAGNIARARKLLSDYVARGDVAVQGGGGNDRTYRLCAEVMNLGLGEAKAQEIIEEIWNPACVPPWDSEELGVVIRNAGHYSQNEPGAWAVTPTAERLDREALDKLIASSGGEEPPPSAVGEQLTLTYGRPKIAGELANGCFPAPWYFWQGFTLGQNVNLTYADGGIGKTLLLLMLAVAGAAGVPLFDRNTVQMPALLVLPEDDFGAIRARLLLVCKALGVELDRLPLYIWCLPGADVCLAQIQDDGTWTEGPFLAPLRALVASFGRPIFLGIETLADIFAMDETKRAAANTAVKKVLGSFCRDFKATVWANGHPSKGAMADGSGYAGSTAWNAAVRNRLTMTRPDPKSSLRILRVAKANYGSEAELELHMVDESLSKLYKAQGLKMCDQHATFPDGGYSTEAGIMEMDERLQTGRLRVTRHLAEWFEEYRDYHRKDGLIVKERDDLLSASRIGVMARRFGRPVLLGNRGPAARSSEPVRIADHTELSGDDLF